MHFPLLSCSLRHNDLGPEAGKEIAKALTTNTTVQNIKYVRSLMKTSFYNCQPRWLIKMDSILLSCAFSPSFLQSFGQQARSRSRKGDCQGPGNQHHGAEHQVRSSSAEFIISLLSSEVVDKNGFLFADLCIFSFLFAVFTTTISVQKQERRLPRPWQPTPRCRTSSTFVLC